MGKKQIRNMRTSRKFLVAFYLLLAMGLAIMVPKLSFGASDNSSVSVSISSISEITVSPESLSWTLPPCDVGTQYSVDITNTGSENVANIHAYVDTLDNETSRPTGTTSSEYAASGIIMLKNETNETWHYAGRLEWNNSEDIANKNLAAVTACSDLENQNCSYGFISNTTYSYMWAIGNGTETGEQTGYCNETGTQLAIEGDDDDGTASTRTPITTFVIGSPVLVDDWALFTVDHPVISQACIAVHYLCDRIYLYKYDRRNSEFKEFSSCAGSSDVQVSNLAPDVTHTLTVNAFAPCGIAAGGLALSNLYIEAT